jgi:ATP-dependent Clp protease ATP-binding subunit ClpA
MITTDKVMALRPCDDFPRERVAAILGDGKTPLEIAEMSDVPASARLWLLLRNPYMTDRQLREFACDCADRALARVDEPDPRSIEAVAVARRFAAGDATPDKLAAAMAAARAAWAAAAWAATKAAWAATRAAWAATETRAAAAAWDADVAATESWQIGRVAEILHATTREAPAHA